jgi:YegS/Rv2252/BmrU family lipid kinase
MKALFLVNARSGARRRHGIDTLIRGACAHLEHEIVACGAKEELDGIVERAERDGVDVVYAVGGDGTVHETAKRLIGRTLALGVVPTGSGNGFARHIGLPMDLRASLRSCRGGRIVTIDTARVNGMPFLATMGVGFDAAIAEAFANAGTRGLRTYVIVGLREVRRFTACDYEIAIDGAARTARAFVVAVANAAHYGNNARIAPLASLQDGLLDVVVVDDVSIVQAAALVPRLFNGTIDRSRHVTITRGKRIEIRRPDAGPAHLDGEPLSLPEQLSIEVVPQSLRVLIPDAMTKI